MTLVDKTNKQAVSIDITIPLAQNLQATNTEKHRKYQELTFQIKQQWQMNKTAVFHWSCLRRRPSLTCITRA
jgi:fructose-1,6-bisphosphatase/sedoheptulose 1,7-bisphosphatase-like protein